MAQFTDETKVEELVEYARDELGVELEGGLEEVTAELKALDPTLFLDQAPAPKSPAGKKAAAAKTKKVEEELVVKIEEGGAEGFPSFALIHIHDDNDDDEFAENFVPVGFNGRMYQVQKGVDAKVPYGVYDVLNNAIEVNYKQRTDPTTKMKYLEEKKTKRWPFSVIRFID